MYCTFKLIIDWKEYKKFVKKIKKSFFDKKIQEIALKNKKLQNLMNQIKKYKFPVIEAL